MARIRLSILLAGCFLLASTAWADDLGYVDCASHPESAQVFSKARQTPDSLGTVTCGERFTILVYGFVFSRVQTKDGQVGYIYSNLISVDHGGTAVAKSAAVPAPATSQATPTNASAVPAAMQPSATAKVDSPPVTTTPAPDKPAPAQAGALFPTPPGPAVTASGMASPSAPAPPASANVQAAPAASQPAPAAPSPAASSATNAPPAASAPSQPAPPSSASTPATPAPAPMPAPAPTQTQPAASSSSAQPQASAPAQPGPLFPTTLPQPPPPPSDTTSAPATAEPAPPPAAVSQPQAEAVQPEAAQPAPEPVRDTGVRSSWERPLPGVSQNFLVQLYSGYAFDRVGSGSSATNLSGAMGSFGYNLKPWLQIVGDTSYNYVTGTGVKNVLYGNHFGGRFFYRPGRWRMTPFVEGLVGGSRYDITISGPGGGATSQNCISYKAGGGVDFHISHRWEIRVIDLDYYRTSFGTNMTQNNYWASAGVVLRLFGSRASE